MFGTSNISRERKLNELYNKIDEKDLISKAYQILTNTENHHLSHEPFYRYCINNSSTVKSCIMDNINNKIYFTYGERLAALNKYLEYDLNSQEVNVYKEKQELEDSDYFTGQLNYKNWYHQNYKGKKKLKEEDYSVIIDEVKQFNLEPAYKAYLLSYYNSKIKNQEKAFLNAEKYIEERPNYYHSYYNKYQIMKSKGDYMDGIVALEEMLQTSTITPYYEYRASVNMIELYDKLLEQDKDQIYIDKINKLANQVRSNLSQYFMDKKTQKDLEFIKLIEDKYKN